MDSYGEFQEDFYHPLVLFKLSLKGGREVAHGVPFPDQLGWLLSFPLVFLPLFVIALAYANGYYLTLGTLWATERAGMYLEQVWRTHLVEYWEEYVPAEYREPIEEAMPETRFEERVTEAERKRREQKRKEMEAKRGQGQKNVKKEGDDGMSFKNQ